MRSIIPTISALLEKGRADAEQRARERDLRRVRHHAEHQIPALVRTFRMEPTVRDGQAAMVSTNGRPEVCVTYAAGGMWLLRMDGQRPTDRPLPPLELSEYISHYLLLYLVHSTDKEN